MVRMAKGSGYVSICTGSREMLTPPAGGTNACFISAPAFTAAASPGQSGAVHPEARPRPLLAALSHFAAAAVIIYRCVTLISRPPGSVQAYGGALRPGAVISLPVHLH